MVKHAQLIHFQPMFHFYTHPPPPTPPRKKPHKTGRIEGGIFMGYRSGTLLEKWVHSFAANFRYKMGMLAANGLMTES